MNANHGPSRSEVERWGPQQLADYLARMGMSGCERVVLKNSISGSRFVNLSDSDLQKFPKLHIPLISKISSEISKKKKDKPGVISRFMNHLNEPEPYADDPTGWDADFDDEDLDDDYESPDSGEEGGVMEDESTTEDYELPPTEPPEDPPHLGPMHPIEDNGDYIDSPRNQPPPPNVRSLPTKPTLFPQPGEPFRRDPSPSPRGGRPSGNFPPGPPKICRDKKPGREPQSMPPTPRGFPPGPGSMNNAHPPRLHLDTPDPPSWSKPPASSSSIMRSNSSAKNSPGRPQLDTPDPPPWSKPPTPSSSVMRSNSSAKNSPGRFDVRNEHTNHEVPKHNTFPLQQKNLPPRPGLPDPPSRPADSWPPHIPSTGSLPPKLSSGSFSRSDRPAPRPAQGLDPRWYVGKVTRDEAMQCLEGVNKDGAYLVRDSSKQHANQPFTLMVYYQDKVFNIQIRQENQQFLLGTGLKAQESFPSVSGIIDHYSQSPLLLIDTKNPQSSQQNQCLLSDPAGFYMTRKNWS